MDSEVPQIVREPGTAKMMGVSEAGLRRMRREGRGPSYVRIGRCIGYRLTDIEAFLSENTVHPSRGKPSKRACATSPE
jgi:predicted DNA-binding transcriptional regulator AlpA